MVSKSEKKEKVVVHQFAAPKKTPAKKAAKKNDDDEDDDEVDGGKQSEVRFLGGRVGSEDVGPRTAAEVEGTTCASH